jgi:hypothetical protein
VSIAGKCPTEWDKCSLILRTSVDFIHNESLRSGELVYSLYQFADAITEVVGRQIPGVKVRYIGPRGVTANFGVTLNGVPQGVTMNTVQQQYFADVTVDFLSATCTDRVLDLQIDKQIDNDGSIQVVGRLLGASYRPATTFVNELGAAFHDGQDVYVQTLITERLRPHHINELGGIEFFEGISSVGGRVDADPDAPTIAPLPGQGQEDDGGNSAMLIVAIGSVLGGLVLIGLACWCRRIRMKSRKERQEIEGYRERMKQERRARREEAKGKSLEQDEDPERTGNLGGTVAPTSDGRQSAGPYRVPYFGKIAKFLKKHPDGPPAEVNIQIQLQSSADKSAKSKEGKEAKDVIPGSQQRRAPLRASKSFQDDPNGGPQKRAPPKPTKSLDENEFGSKLGHTPYLGKIGEHEDETSTASESPSSAKAKGASPAALPMKAQPEQSVNKVVGSRSVQHQPSPDLSAKSKKVKEAEDDHHASQQKRAQLQASKPFEDDLPRAAPQKRAPPRRTKSLDGNEFGPELGQNRVHYPGKINKDIDKTGTASKAPPSAKAKGVSPAALSRFMKAQPEQSANKLIGSRSVQYQPPATLSDMSKKVKEAEDAPPGSLRKKPRLRASKSFEDDLPRAPPQKRPPPPKAKKSFNENKFGPELGQNLVPYIGKTSEAPTPAKAKGASPAALLRFMKAQPVPSVNKVTGSQPSMDASAKSKKVKEAEDAPPGSLRKKSRLRASKSFEDDLPRAPPQKRSPPPKATKSLDENEFRSKLGHNRGPYLGKIVEDIDKTSTASEAQAPTPAKAKGASPAALSKFMKAQPVPSVNKVTGSRSVQLQPSMDASAKSKKVKEAEDAPPGSLRKKSRLRASKSFEDDLPRAPPQKRSPPPKATKSLDENEFRSKLGHNRGPYLGKIVEDIDKTSTASEAQAPTPAKAKGASPAALSKFMKAQPEPSVNKVVGSRSVQLQPSMDVSGHSKKVKEAEDAPPGSLRKKSRLRASKSFGDNLPSKTPLSPQKRTPPKPTKSVGGNEFRRKLVQNPIPYLQSQIDEDNDKPGKALNAPTVIEKGPQSGTSAPVLRSTVGPRRSLPVDM